MYFSKCNFLFKYFYDHLLLVCFTEKLASPILHNDSLKFNLNLQTDLHIIYVAEDRVISCLFLFHII